MPSALTFSISDVRLGIDVTHVREVVPSLRLVRPPETPAILRGFLNLRGEMVPVLRLEALLQLDLGGRVWEPELSLQARLVVAKLDGMSIAWMVDEGVELMKYDVTRTVRLPADHVLNNCAERVIPRAAPQMSIVLLSPSKVLMESESVRLRQLILREKSRQEAFETVDQSA